MENSKSNQRPTVASYVTTFLKPEMRHIYRQVTNLQRVRTVVYCRQNINQEQYPFSPVEVLPEGAGNFLRRFILKYIRKAPPLVYRGEQQILEQALDRHNVDLLHIYFGHTGVHLLPFIKVWDRPVIVSFHGMDVQTREDRPGYREDLEELLQTVALVLARSDSLAERLRELGCPEDKIRLNRTAIPLDAFELVKRDPPVDGRWHIVQACRLIRKKGLPTALRAFRLFHDAYPQAQFTIAGEGPDLPELERLTHDLGLDDAVTFAGFLKQTDLVELYRQSHIFLHPSEMPPDGNQEGVPNSMLEAMATGLPVVATTHGGIPEAVDHDQSGLLYSEGDDAAIGNALIWLAEDPERWLEMGKTAAAHVKSRFEMKTQIRKLEDCYLEVLKNG